MTPQPRLKPGWRVKSPSCQRINRNSVGKKERNSRHLSPGPVQRRCFLWEGEGTKKKESMVWIKKLTRSFFCHYRSCHMWSEWTIHIHTHTHTHTHTQSLTHCPFLVLLTRLGQKKQWHGCQKVNTVMNSGRPARGSSPSGSPLGRCFNCPSLQ